MNPTRYYYANSANQPVGPFTVAELLAMERSGILANQTQICPEGGVDWVPIASLAGPTTGRAIATSLSGGGQSKWVPQPSGVQHSVKDIKAIALYQKVIQFCVLAFTLAYIAIFAFEPSDPSSTKSMLLLLVGTVILVVGQVFVFLLAGKLYGPGIAVFLGLLVLVPGIGYIVLLMINSKATQTLSYHGIKVGLLGAKNLPR